jgi:acetylornithine/N-succinyldiaminopimelate aminotransferase
MNKKKLIEIAENRLLKVTDRPPVIMERGSGMFLYDTEGNRYLDFIGGWAVNCLGHSPKVLVDVLARQASTLMNASPSFYNLPMLQYADSLLAQCCFDRVFFTSTGAEANEGAIKLARKWGQLKKNGAAEIITTHHGFHGRTLTTMSATGKEQWENLFEPKTRGFVKATFNDLDSVEKLVSAKTCAIMLEPVQGEGGVNVATHEFIDGLRLLCDRHNILLIFDEIQTGMGRTGRMFCYEHYNIEPDIMTLGKGIGGGFPLAAVLAKEFLNIFDAGDQGGTYTGQPLAMAVGQAVLQELLDKDLVGNCRRMGELIRKNLAEMAEDTEIDNIRGKGLLLAFDLQQTPGKELVKRCLEDGLVINSPKEKSIRLIPPLIVSALEIEEMMAILRRNIAGI